MKSLAEFPQGQRQNIEIVFTDIDDTLTTGGHLTANAYLAMQTLHQKGLHIVPITGRPAGWCDHIARMWPVSGVVGENGAFYFRYDHPNKRMIRHYSDSAELRRINREKLTRLGKIIITRVRGSALSADQLYRETDLAIDYCEDVPSLPEDDVKRIVELFEENGATAKVSSIHVNGWFGNYDKLSMSRIFSTNELAIDLDMKKEACIFVGDSPNDAPMFDFFPHSVGVANVLNFLDQLSAQPAYVTQASGGTGFAEVADLLLDT